MEIDQIPPDQSLASGSIVKSACISSNGLCGAGQSEGAGRVIEPRKCEMVVARISSLSNGRVKADGVLIPEGSSSEGAMAKFSGHHRGLGAGHALIGATRGLGRADCLPLGMPEAMGHRLNKGPGAEGALRRAPRRVSVKGNTNETVQARVSGDDSEKRRSPRRAVGSLSGS